MTVPAGLLHFLAPWARAYEAHQALSVTVRYLHLAGLLLGGGTAIATDRTLFRARRGDDPKRAAALDVLARSHRTVVPALAVVLLTGALMAAADLATFAGSRLFWMKMALVAVLVINGAALVTVESSIRHRADSRGWTRLLVSSIISIVFWFLTLLAGTWLTVAA